MTLIALQMDKVSRLNPLKDTTLFLAREAFLRKATLFAYQPHNLSLLNGELMASGCYLDFDPATEQWHEQWHEQEDGVVLPLVQSDFLLMRQDPPFDMNYLTASWLLERLQQHKFAPRIINDPRGVRNCPEKLAACFFPSEMPPTLVTNDASQFRVFYKQHGSVVLKPLHDKGGAGIFVLHKNDPNAMSAFETLKALYQTPIMVQLYDAAIETTGDKRIILIDGNYVGSFSRLSAQGEGRANLIRGGRVIKGELTDFDEKLIATLRPFLREHGLFLVGLDVIGENLTEINVTSPTGLVDLENFTGVHGAKIFWDALL